MPRFSAYFFILLFLLGFALNANAALVSVAGPISSDGTAPGIIAPPSDLLDDFVVNTGMQGFDEAQNVLTSVAHSIDGGVISANTLVDSHMIFLNSAGGRVIRHFGIVWTFTDPILGVMSDVGGTLEAASTFELGNPATNYTVTFPGSGPAAPFNLRGLESMNNPITGEGYSINGNELTVGMRVSEPGDWIRVVTQSPIVPTPAAIVPIPGAIWLLGTGFVGLVVLRRRMKA